MPDFKLSADYLSRNKAYEVQRTNNFQVSFSNIANGETLTFAVESFPLPTIANEPIELSHGNTRVKVAGQATFEGGDLVLKDFMIADTEAVIEAWRRRVYNPLTDAVGWAADYKVDGTVYEFSPDGSHVRTWSLIGCWPSSVNYGELSNDGSDKKQVTVTITYDKAIRNL